MTLEDAMIRDAKKALADLARGAANGYPAKRELSKEDGTFGFAVYVVPVCLVPFLDTLISTIAGPPQDMVFEVSIEQENRFDPNLN